MSKVKHFLNDMQAEFMANDLEAVADRMSVPLVVYSIAGVIVLRTRADILARLGMYRDAIIAQGIVTVSIEVLSEADVVNNRLRVKARACYFSKDGNEVADSLIRYFVVQADDGMEIEMMEYLEAPLPSDEVTKLIH